MMQTNTRFFIQTCGCVCVCGADKFDIHVSHLSVFILVVIHLLVFTLIGLNESA